MSENATTLSPLAQRIAVKLEQATYAPAQTVLSRLCVELRKCAIAFRTEFAEALSELETAGLIESHIPGTRLSGIEACVPLLNREFRLSRRGHMWKCNHLRSITGAHRYVSRH